MKTSLHRIKTKDDLELVGLLYEPENSTNKVLVHVHGMAGNFYENKFLDFIAETLTANGVAFFTFNNRGTEFIKDMCKVDGEKRDIVRLGDTYEKFEDCILDIGAAIDFVEQKGFKVVHLSGHSLAGPKVAYYTAKAGDKRVVSVIFLSPADMVGLSRNDKNFERDIATAKKMIAEGHGKEIMPFDVWEDCILSADSYMSLSGEQSEVAIFNFYNPQDELKVLGKIIIPSITVMGRKDHVVIIPIENLMERIKKAMVVSPKVETKILGDADHAYNGYGQELADTINTWIQKM
ncbi:MAG: alpha/beta fold hydrolase [Candidatus Paceibacterota bacterium]|jgi:dienelactone hydrolase